MDGYGTAHIRDTISIMCYIHALYWLLIITEEIDGDG